MSGFLTADERAGYYRLVNRKKNRSKGANGTLISFLITVFLFAIIYENLDQLLTNSYVTAMLIAFIASAGAFAYFCRLLLTNKISAQERAIAVCFLALEAVTELTETPLQENKEPAESAIRDLATEFGLWFGVSTPKFAKEDVNKLSKALIQRVMPAIDRIQPNELIAVCNRLAELLNKLKGKPTLKELGDIASELEQLPAREARAYTRYLRLLFSKVPMHIFAGLIGSVALPIILILTIGIDKNTAVQVWVGVLAVCITVWLAERRKQ